MRARPSTRKRPKEKRLAACRSAKKKRRARSKAKGGKGRRHSSVMIVIKSGSRALRAWLPGEGKKEKGRKRHRLKKKETCAKKEKKRRKR